MSNNLSKKTKAELVEIVMQLQEEVEELYTENAQLKSELQEISVWRELTHKEIRWYRNGVERLIEILHALSNVEQSIRKDHHDQTQTK